MDDVGFTLKLFVSKTKGLLLFVETKAADSAGPWVQKMKTAYATIKGFEVMRALKKGQGRCFNFQGGIKGEVRMIERAFGLGPCAMSEVMVIVKEELAKAA